MRRNSGPKVLFNLFSPVAPAPVAPTPAAPAKALGISRQGYD